MGEPSSTGPLSFTGALATPLLITVDGMHVLLMVSVDRESTDPLVPVSAGSGT
jgi:hypothetical protein